MISGGEEVGEDETEEEEEEDRARIRRVLERKINRTMQVSGTNKILSMLWIHLGSRATRLMPGHYTVREIIEKCTSSMKTSELYELMRALGPYLYQPQLK